jgi:hypothetical protein
MHIASIGIDIGKSTFHLVALDEQVSMVVRKKFSRKQLLTYTSNLSALGITDFASCNSCSSRP